MDNQMIIKEESYVRRTGAIHCRQRLEGMLNYYYREAV